VLTVSAFSASEITAAFGIPASRITVAPLGVHGTFAAGDPNVSLDLPANVTEPYLLHVGDIHERRNLPSWSMPFSRHAGTSARPPHCRSSSLASTAASLTDCAHGAQRRAAPTRSWRSDRSARNACTRSTAARSRLVYPSLYEGFGLPLIEAMACGTPVIASHAASIPEVLGGAGLLLDPRDVSAWRDAIIRIVNDEALTPRSAVAGLARAATFTWQRTAQITLDVYREVARAA
jgi:alpha-1,3-rhamnosyl/mannosyltransferase